jgi:hypothetical protein
MRSIARNGLFLAAATGILGAGAAGCSSTSAPRLAITEVTVSEENQNAMVLRFSVQGENPNPFPLPLEEVRYRLELSGERVFSGVRSAQITIPRSSSAIVSLPVSFELTGFDGTLNGPEPYRLTGSVRYRPDGTFPGVLFDSGVYRPVASFSSSGTLDFTPLGQTGPFPEGDSASVRIGGPDEDQ